MKNTMKTNNKHAKRLLRQKGWSYRSAAKQFGVCYQHLSDVLNGRRESRRLLNAIADIPQREREEAA